MSLKRKKWKVYGLKKRRPTGIQKFECPLDEIPEHFAYLQTDTLNITGTYEIPADTIEVEENTPEHGLAEITVKYGSSDPGGDNTLRDNPEKGVMKIVPIRTDVIQRGKKFIGTADGTVYSIESPEDYDGDEDDIDKKKWILAPEKFPFFYGRFALISIKVAVANLNVNTILSKIGHLNQSSLPNAGNIPARHVMFLAPEILVGAGETLAIAVFRLAYCRGGWDNVLTVRKQLLEVKAKDDWPEVLIKTWKDSSPVEDHYVRPAGGWEDVDLSDIDAFIYWRV